MYDIKLLEEEWRQYNRKKQMPIYIGIGFLLLLCVIMFYLLTREKKIDIVANTKLETKQKINKENKSKNVERVKKTVTLNNNTQKAPIDIVVNNIPVLEDSSTDNSVIEKVHKKVHLRIVESSDVDAYKDVEKRFYVSRNEDDALFLAKTYYRKKQYKKASYWALQTNKLNATIDDSWIIFAQSKLKLGHKNEAENILLKYIKRTDSEKVKNVLYDIKRSK